MQNYYLKCLFIAEKFNKENFPLNWFTFVKRWSWFVGWVKVWKVIRSVSAQLFLSVVVTVVFQRHVRADCWQQQLLTEDITIIISTNWVWGSKFLSRHHLQHPGPTPPREFPFVHHLHVVWALGYQRVLAVFTPLFRAVLLWSGHLPLKRGLNVTKGSNATLARLTGVSRLACYNWFTAKAHASSWHTGTIFTGIVSVTC